MAETRREDWAALIHDHVRYFTSAEKPSWDKALNYYQGNFHNGPAALESDERFASFNMVYAVAETGVAALIPPNPTVSADIAVADQSHERLREIEAHINYRLKKSVFRRESRMALVEGELYGRGVFKTSLQGGKAVARAISPRHFFFDRTARRPEDLVYAIHATTKPLVKVRKRMKRGAENRYFKVDEQSLKVDSYPDWMRLPADGERRAMIDHLKWVTIYEVYDFVESKVLHLLSDGQVLLDTDLTMNPFDMFYLNWDGEGCGGLSEVQLILGLQDLINEILTRWLRISDSTDVPVWLFDASAVSFADIDEAAQDTTPNGFRGVRMLSGAKTLAETFFKLPTAGIEATQLELLEKLERVMSIVSAQADAARGQAVNVRTATELAQMDAYLRTRLAARQEELYAAQKSVAEKMLWLEANHVVEPAIIGGKESFIEEGEAAELTMTAYNPIRSNPAVRAEAMTTLLLDLRNPQHGYDQHKVSKELLVLNELNLNLLPDQPPEPPPGPELPPPGPEGMLPPMGPPAPPMELPLEEVGGAVNSIPVEAPPVPAPMPTLQPPVI